MTHPYAALTPDLVLDACAIAGLRPDGRLLSLNSYENRVYQVWLEEDSPVVVKFYRPGRWTDAQIEEEHAFAAELAEREIPVVAPLAHGGRTLHKSSSDPVFPFAVYPRRGGRTPELEDRETLEWIGRFIARIHAVGATKKFQCRETLDIQSFGHNPRDYLLKNRCIPKDLLASWTAVADACLQKVAACYARANDVQLIRLHGDCHVGNILWTDGNQEKGPLFVDLDDSRMGPAIQDLWMLLSGERASQQHQLGDVLAGYEDFMELDRRELNLVEALRTLRLLHYSAWIARRWDDPAFPAAFPWFGTQRYWQDRILELKEQVALMDEPPLIV